MLKLKAIGTEHQIMVFSTHSDVFVFGDATGYIAANKMFERLAVDNLP